MIRLIVLAFLFLSLVTNHSFAEENNTTKGKEGFWRIARTDSVWWFISPSGQPEFLTSVTTIQPKQNSWVENAPHFQSKDFNGDHEAWAKITSTRVKEYGFKAVGAWSHPSLIKYVPFSKDLNLILYPSVPIDHPDWAKQIEEAVAKQIKPLKDEKNLIGYYLDNELNWWQLEPYAAKYFKVTCDAVRKYDPNHLILGVRFNSYPPDSVVRASKGFVDVHSVNQYSDDGKLWWDMFKQINLLSGCPIIRSEFSFYSLDNRSGCKNTQGFGGKVNTLTDRARMYEFTVNESAKCSFIIGAEWFQWNDEPPDGRAGKGHALLREDCAFGIVDIFDKPYTELINSVVKVSKGVNDVHKNGGKSQVWK